MDFSIPIKNSIESLTMSTTSKQARVIMKFKQKNGEYIYLYNYLEMGGVFMDG